MNDPAEPLPEKSADDDRPETLPVAANDDGKHTDDDSLLDGAEEHTPTDEGLPEWEPLTPELVEDEAIRGDFMLRWAVILLAFLMGWTVVQETAVLTHIKSGEALTSGGWLPSGRDTLSSTATESRWVHLPWLFDAVLAEIFAITGPAGLSILKAILAAVIFWTLSRISLPGVPTWWGSVCGALALVACFPSLTATPHIVTLLGMAILLLLLHRQSQATVHRFAWPILVTIIVWNQLDDRAWIGAVTLLAYALGHQWDLRQSSSDAPSARSGSLVSVALASLLAMLVHPFGWQTWLSPIKLYQIEYPAQRVYAKIGEADFFRHFPLWSSQFWTINYFSGAALLLWGVTLVVLVLNARIVRMSHLAVFITTSLIALAGGTELAVASLVFAALATVNAQQWYAASFRQSYSVETGELLFSRGGRALTVIALFSLGFVMVAGHLTGTSGRRVGTGFDAELTQMIDSYHAVLAEAYDDRPFSFLPAQGDVLNWIGDHPFLDSRLRLFAAGSPSIVDEHLQARAALRIPLDGSPQQSNLWQTVFDKYDIHQALPRLSGEVPDYTTFNDLLHSTEWAMTGLGSETAVFCRTDRKNADLAAYIDEHLQSNLLESQLRTRDKAEIVSDLRTTWPQSPSVYSRYFYQPPPATSRPLQRARHYLDISEGSDTVGQAVSATYAAIRDVHRGLPENPSDEMAYMVLGQAYATLWGFERGLMEAQNLGYPSAMRYAQTTSAYHQAIVCDPRHALPHLRLFAVYTQQQRHDLALHHLQEFQRLTGRLTPLPDSHPSVADEQSKMEEYLAALSVKVNEARLQRDEDLAAGMDAPTLARSLADTGFPLTALETIESDLTRLSGEPALGLLYARLLLEAGRTRDAYDQFQGLKTIADGGQLPDLATYAAISEVVAEDLKTALTTLEQEHQTLASAAAMAMLYQHPLQAAGPSDGSQPVDPLLPVARQLQLAGVYFDQFLPRLEANTLYRAWILLELGRNADAANLLDGLLAHDPISSLRPIAEAYLSLMSADAQVPPIPDVDSLTPVVPDLFADDASDVKAEEKPNSEDPTDLPVKEDGSLPRDNGDADATNDKDESSGNPPKSSDPD